MVSPDCASELINGDLKHLIEVPEEMPEKRILVEFLMNVTMHRFNDLWERKTSGKEQENGNSIFII